MGKKPNRDFDFIARFIVATDAKRGAGGQKTRNALVQDYLAEQQQRAEEVAEMERLIRRVVPREAGVIAIAWDLAGRRVRIEAGRPDLVEGARREIVASGWDVELDRAPPEGQGGEGPGE